MDEVYCAISCRLLENRACFYYSIIGQAAAAVLINAKAYLEITICKEAEAGSSLLKQQYILRPAWHIQNINLYIINMRKLKRTRVVLWVLAIVLFTIYVYVYIGNPLEKSFNLGIIGLIFSAIFCFSWILFRKKRFTHEIALLLSCGLSIVFYLAFL